MTGALCSQSFHGIRKALPFLAIQRHKSFLSEQRYRRPFPLRMIRFAPGESSKSIHVAEIWEFADGWHSTFAMHVNLAYKRSNAADIKKRNSQMHSEGRSPEQIPRILLLGGNTLLQLEVLLERAVVVLEIESTGQTNQDSAISCRKKVEQTHDVLQVAAVTENTVLGAGLEVLLASKVGEAPLLGDNDLLATGELVTGTAERLHDDRLVAVTSADGEENLADVDTSNGVVRLSPSATHTGLKPVEPKRIEASGVVRIIENGQKCVPKSPAKTPAHPRVNRANTVQTGTQVQDGFGATLTTWNTTAESQGAITTPAVHHASTLRNSPISTGARKHLVDADDVEGVNTDAEMERVLAARLGDVLVSTDTSSLKRLRGDLLVLVTNEMAAEREVVHTGLLTAKIEDTNLERKEKTALRVSSE